MITNKRLSVPDSNAAVPLKQLIGSLLCSYQPVAVKQNSFFVNEIPGNLVVKTDKNVLITLFGSLFYVMARASHDTCIRVSVKMYENVLLLYVKDSSCSNNYRVLAGLTHLQLLADKLGGVFHLSGDNSRSTTIAFSLPTSLAA